MSEFHLNLSDLENLNIEQMEKIMKETEEKIKSLFLPRITSFVKMGCETGMTRDELFLFNKMMMKKLEKINE